MLDLQALGRELLVFGSRSKKLKNRWTTQIDVRGSQQLTQFATMFKNEKHEPQQQNKCRCRFKI